MKFRKKNSEGIHGLFISLILLYILLIFLVIGFSAQIIADVSRGKTFQGSLIGILAIVFSLFLLGIVVVNLIHLFRDRAAGKPGVRFKIRLVLFFIVIVSLSSIPQGILSINFINTAMHSWFSSRLSDSLSGGLSIAMTYYNEKLETLRGATRNRFVTTLLERAEREPLQTWENLRLVSPDIDCFQLFSAEGESLFSGGETAGFIEGRFAAEAADGILPRETRSPGLTILRTKKTIEAERKKTFVILSIILPKEFDKHAEELTTTIETFSRLDENRYLFIVAVTVFYAFFSFPLLLLAVLISFLLSDEITRPIVNLEEATRRVAEGDFSYRVLSRSKDDLSMLAASFNKMVAELDKSRMKLLQTEKVAAWQEIAQRLAHEIKNPLTPIKLSAQRLLKRYKEEAEDFTQIIESATASIIRETDGIDKLLTEFRNFSRLPAPKPAAVSLKDLIEEVEATYRHTAAGVIFHSETISADIVLHVDHGQIRQVFANLLTNALEALPQGGAITFRADLVKKGNTKYCKIQVEDTGDGISKDDHSKVFNPYYTTKHGGTGLGLSIVERIIFDHKGQIWFESEPGIGTTFFLDLPTEQTV